MHTLQRADTWESVTDCCVTTHGDPSSSTFHCSHFFMGLVLDLSIFVSVMVLWKLDMIHS